MTSISCLLSRHVPALSGDEMNDVMCQSYLFDFLLSLSSLQWLSCVPSSCAPLTDIVSVAEAVSINSDLRRTAMSCPFQAF